LFDLLLLLLVLAFAAGARVGYLMAYADGGDSDGPILVQDPSPVLELPAGTEMRGQTRISERDALIHNVKAHRWFGSLAPLAPKEEQTAHVARATIGCWRSSGRAITWFAGPSACSAP